jgi:hypothetical protein
MNDQGKIQVYDLSNESSNLGDVGEVCFIPDMQPLLTFLKTKELKSIVRYAEDLSHSNLRDLSL